MARLVLGSPARRVFAALLAVACLGTVPARADDMKPEAKPDANPDAKPDGAPPAEPGMGDPAMDDPAMADPAAAPAADAPKRGGLPNPFWDPKNPVLLKDAQVELSRLEDYLKKPKSENSDILASLDAAAKAYTNLVPNDDAGKATFEADHKKLSAEAEKLFVRALDLVRVQASTSANARDDVNVKAAQILGWCRKEVTPKLVDAIEKLRKAKDYDPPTTLYDEIFKSIALINDHKVGLPAVKDWMKYSTNKGDAERTKAAYDALILFEGVKGSERSAIVKQTLISFVGTESSAERGRTKEEQTQKVVWDKVKGAIIKAMQVYCRQPKAKDGALMAKLRDFDQWYRDHDSPRDPAWEDVTVVGEKK